ncbi:ABC transporter ATP-binding protein [Frigoriflavimonas asaccharolytica]|uniref:ABC-type multidrug transport system ATPase subunit n=1 Tax=Frigoriflavimonas asaccharolytica TaxID=2735899 RepID=A0A8J8GAJ1_9FLAO|nr:ABC transporter ATP-binding protein [Frigoriflavimonas asaccharolytica]NRS93012.1 ABC-type multidrug transport system ATPase subunit [Frigoriflavimonas asaccharolytica]
MMNSIIQFDEVSVKYGDVEIVSNFSAEIYKGESTVFSGVSGSGKSSLLNACLGFVPISAGEIIILNKKVNSENIHEIRKEIAWLPQELFFDIKNCRDLVQLPFQFEVNKKYQASEKDLQKMLADLLLPDHILEKKLSEISGGQKQRLLLASLLLMPKPILILDEPTSALDEISTESVLKIIKKQGKTLISASHDSVWNDNMDKIITI